jgi:hypothetical protein
VELRPELSSGLWGLVVGLLELTFRSINAGLLSGNGNWALLLKLRESRTPEQRWIIEEGEG